MWEPVNIPKMPKADYDSLIERQHVSRIAFGAGEHPSIAPFMYVFDGKYLYFLSTKYGRKIEYFKHNPTTWDDWGVSNKVKFVFPSEFDERWIEQRIKETLEAFREQRNVASRREGSGGG